MPGSVIFFVTTLPAPMTTSLQISTGRMVALVPMETRSPILVGFHSARLPRAGPPVWKRSLTNMAPWEMKQSSPIATSSQTKACDWILVRLPRRQSFWISTKGPMKQSSPIWQPYRFTGSITVTPVPKFTSVMPLGINLAGCALISISLRTGEDADHFSSMSWAGETRHAPLNAVEKVIDFCFERLLPNNGWAMNIPRTMDK